MKAKDKTIESLIDDINETNWEDYFVDETKDGYLLMQFDNETFDYYQANTEELAYVYKVYDPDGNNIYEWQSKTSALELRMPEYLKSEIRKTFIRYVNIDRVEKEEEQESAPMIPSYNFQDNPTKKETKKSNILNPYWQGYYEPKYISDEEAFKKYNNSNTLCLHKSDPTTTMLDQIYKGKGWDVINDCYEISHETLHKLIDSHERVVMLGHGTSGGLIGFIRDCCAKHLKGKNVFVIWCNADKYFERYLPEMKGKFITKNAPSEVWECRAAGCGNISAELMLENITYWCKLCGDVVDDCLAGNVEQSVDYIRKNYLEKYGNHPVTIFNADSAHAFGSDKPLPDYEFKGKKLQPKDYPYPNFDEEEFLEHPTARV